MEKNITKHKLMEKITLHERAIIMNRIQNFLFFPGPKSQATKCFSN